MKNRLIWLFAAVCALTFSACEGDGDADYGFGKIYMPQAVSTGGLDNTYAVPAGGGEYTRNFSVADGKVNIALGVARSGKLSDAKGFSVEVYVSDEKTAAAAAQAEGMAMTPDMYTLPASVEVEAGKSGATFSLVIPVATLTQSEYSGQRLVLSVGLRNPTAYELAETGTETVVIVDVEALKVLI